MKRLDVVQVTFFKPILDRLMDAGANVDRLLRNSGLNTFRLDKRENYVPAQSVYAFFHAIRQHEGIQDFLGQFAKFIQLDVLSQWGRILASTPDVLTLCQNAVKYDQVTSSQQRLRLEINDTQARLASRFVDHSAPGRDQAFYLKLAMGINTFRFIAGPNWAPLEIHLQSRSAPNLDTLLPAGNTTKIYLGQPATDMVFPTSMLAWPMRDNDQHIELSSDVPIAPVSLRSKIERLLESNRMEVMLSLDCIAEMAEMASRTLKRKLAEEDTTFFDVLDQWRFKTALRLLADPKTSIKDISTELRYANVPHFVRAFRRWTNTTPQRFRDTH